MLIRHISRAAVIRGEIEYHLSDISRRACYYAGSTVIESTTGQGYYCTAQDVQTAKLQQVIKNTIMPAVVEVSTFFLSLPWC